jgi:hypothetical protein
MPHRPPTSKQVEKRVQKRAACYFEESVRRKEMEPQARSDLAHKGALLFEHLHALVLEKLTGTGKAEETRTVSSLDSAHRRCLRDLGLLEGDLIDAELPEL